jgi:hypothetical protein
MPRLISLATLALLASSLGCGDRGGPTQPPEGLGAGPAPSAVPNKTADERVTRERLAHRVARAMSEPGFRAYVKSALDRSTVGEHKVQFQRFLGGGNRRALREVARLNGESEAGIETDARQAIPLELYVPVPAHRARWAGGENILVATQREDGEAPVAYDVRGHRHILRTDAPPDTPVLALVPVETDFDHPSAAPFICCSSGGPTPPAGLYMTASHFVQSFEGWLKGSPEYEIHILGQSGATDSLTSYQCAGEHASGYYVFDQNNLDWTGSVLLFSQAQLDAYKSQHPGQNFRIVAFEDDDGECSIRLDGARFKAFQTTLQNSYPNLTGSKDTTSGGLVKIVKRANALQKILRAAYSFITSQDDLIGNAIEDVVVGEYHAGFNWIVRGENNVTNGWLKLQMR